MSPALPSKAVLSLIFKRKRETGSNSPGSFNKSKLKSLKSDLDVHLPLWTIYNIAIANPQKARGKKEVLTVRQFKAKD